MSDPRTISTDGSGQELHFLPLAISNRHSANYYDGDDIRLHIGIRIDGGTFQLIANDRIGDGWGKRIALGTVDPERPAKLLVSFSNQQIVLQFGAEQILFRAQAQLSPILALQTTAAIDVCDVGSPQEPLPLLAEADRPSEAAAAGFLDFAHVDERSGLLILAGWFRDIETEGQWPAEAVAAIVGSIGEHVSRAQLIWFDRPDLGGAGIGCLISIHDIAAAVRPLADIVGLRIFADNCGSAILTNRITGFHEHGRQAALDILDRARGVSVAAIRALLIEPPKDTEAREIDAAPPESLSGGMERAVEQGIHIDHVIVASNAGLVLIGRAKPYAAYDGVPLRGRSTHPVPLAWRSIDAAEGKFVAFASAECSADDEYRIEPWAGDGSITITARDFSQSTGWSAMREILDALPPWPAAPDDLFDRVIGPPLIALNDQRLSSPITAEIVDFGDRITAPRCSIIVPLFGRLDFMIYQLALFSVDRRGLDEIIYVLDQPERRDELLALGRSAFARFRQPFRILLPSEGRGFGPASNLGLVHARGEHVCFLNSDAFPSTVDWLDHMIASLVQNEDIGVVGARLLFADGSIQHDGMAIEPVPAIANWLFPLHPGKGGRPMPAKAEMRDVDAVTGACMVIRRNLAEELGGFDPIYPIGDFEDADLCARISARMLRCVMNDRAILYHFERQSQGCDSEAWRTNLTLLNAWHYQRRWNPKRQMPTME